MARDPFAQEAIVPLEDGTRATEDLLSPARGKGDLREPVREVRWRQRRVIVERPQSRTRLRRRDDPADPQPREGLGLAQPVHHERPVVPAPEAVRSRTFPPRAAADL